MPLQNVEKLSAERYSAVLVALAVNVQHPAVIGSADVTYVSANELLRPQTRPASKDVKTIARSRSGQSLLRADPWSASIAATSSVTVSAPWRFVRRLGQLKRRAISV